MKINIIYVCKNHLIGIDYTLPLLMELKKRYNHININVLLNDLNQKNEEIQAWKLVRGLKLNITSRSMLLALFKAWNLSGDKN